MLNIENKEYGSIEELIDEVKDKSIESVNLPTSIKHRLINLVPENSNYKQSFENYLKNIAKDFVNHFDKLVTVTQVNELYLEEEKSWTNIPKNGLRGTKTDLRILFLNWEALNKLTDLINENINQKKEE